MGALIGNCLVCRNRRVDLVHHSAFAIATDMCDADRAIAAGATIFVGLPMIAATGISKVAPSATKSVSTAADFGSDSEGAATAPVSSSTCGENKSASRLTHVTESRLAGDVRFMAPHAAERIILADEAIYLKSNARPRGIRHPAAVGGATVGGQPRQREGLRAA